MNKQEIDRLSAALFEKYCIYGAYGGPQVGRPSFNSAIHEAAAEIRRQARQEALEEAASVCESYRKQVVITSFQAHTARQLETAIRALAQTSAEQEKS